MEPENKIDAEVAKELQEALHELPVLCEVVDKFVSKPTRDALHLASKLGRNPLHGVMALMTVQVDYLARGLVSYQEIMRGKDDAETDLALDMLPKMFTDMIAQTLPKAVEKHRETLAKKKAKGGEDETN